MLKATSGVSGTVWSWTQVCLTLNAIASLPASLGTTHLHITIGEQQVHDDIQAQQLHAVQSPLQAGQLLPQLLPTKPLPCLSDVLPNGLPKIATNLCGRRGRKNSGACPSAPAVPSPASSWCTLSAGPHYQESVGVASSRRANRPTRGVSRASVPALA